MNTCDTCKHWNQNPIYPDRHIKYEISGTCGNPKLDSEPSEKGNQDCAQGGEPADWTGITTGPKFGCIHFKATEEAVCGEEMFKNNTAKRQEPTIQGEYISIEDIVKKEVSKFLDVLQDHMSKPREDTTSAEAPLNSKKSVSAASTAISTEDGKK